MSALFKTNHRGVFTCRGGEKKPTYFPLFCASYFAFPVVSKKFISQYLPKDVVLSKTDGYGKNVTNARAFLFLLLYFGNRIIEKRKKSDGRSQEVEYTHTFTYIHIIVLN